MNTKNMLQRILAVALGVGILTIILAVAEERGASNDPPAISRSEAIETAATDPVAWDCAVRQPARGTIASESEFLFRVEESERVMPAEGRDYTTAIWSPHSDTVIFVAPTNQIRSVSQRARGLVGISVNELWLYRPTNKEWKLITKDGASPRFSPDGQALYYLAHTELMRFDFKDQTVETTGISVSETAESLTMSVPLRDGTLLAPPALGKPFQHVGAIQPEWPSWELTLADRLLVSPTDTHAVINYGADHGGKSTPPVSILYTTDGQQRRSLLRNCSYSSTQLAWSPDGTSLAYPVLGDWPAIHLVDVFTSVRRILTPFGNDPRRLSSISFAPQSRFFAITAGDRRDGSPEIWVVSADGAARQRIVTGMLPHLSPDGRHLLYAIPGRTRLLDWHLVSIEEM